MNSPTTLQSQANVRNDTSACCVGARSVLQGAWRFALVSIAGFSVWAFAGNRFRAHGGEVGLYTASALIFLSVAGLLMHPLVKSPRPLARFYAVFVPSFLAYSMVWSACWFLLRFGAGEWLGSLAGSICFVSVCGWRFGNMRSVLAAAVVFFLAHSMGYFAGGKLMQFLLSSGVTGFFSALTKSQLIRIAQLSWGVLYGLGFGAGLGYAFYLFQLPALARAEQTAPQ
jgi:hypothetical protein